MSAILPRFPTAPSAEAGADPAHEDIALDAALLQRTGDFIRAHWDETVRVTPVDAGNLIALDAPYTVPSRKGGFQELYYWDTYYTSVGLIADGRVDLARGNADALLGLVRRFGFVPNGNLQLYLDRSQPPHLALLVDAVWRAAGDREWLRGAYDALAVEHGFWQSRRMSPTGLNRHGQDCTEATLIGAAHHPRVQVPVRDRHDELEAGGHFVAECESGCDFTSRFDRRCSDFVSVDLNALLHRHEQLMAGFAAVLRRSGDARQWLARARERRELMREVLWDAARGLFADWDAVHHRFATVITPATFYPHWLGVADPAQARALEAVLPRLELAHGLAAADAGTAGSHLQWDHPNVWAPHQYAAALALDRSGHPGAARRIARKWLRLVAANFARTGDLWEKYHGVDGGTRTVDEYEMPAMLGWTAGVFQVFAQRWG